MTAMDNYCWNKFRKAVYDAAQIELVSWYDESTFQHSWKATRHSIDPRWVRLNFDEAVLVTMPEGYVEREVNDMLDKLFQPILDLPWETYFDDLWYVVYADKHKDRVITNPVTLEEFRKGVVTMNEAAWREREF